MKKEVIYEFDPVIYPFKLWVSIANNTEYIKSKFLYYPEKEELNFKGKVEFDASVDTVMHKETKMLGFLVYFVNSKACTNGIIAHEATHVSDRVWEHLGERKKAKEANAYLVEWIVDCIEKVKLNKLSPSGAR